MIIYLTKLTHTCTLFWQRFLVYWTEKLLTHNYYSIRSHGSCLLDKKPPKFQNMLSKALFPIRVAHGRYESGSYTCHYIHYLEVLALLDASSSGRVCSFGFGFGFWGLLSPGSLKIYQRKKIISLLRSWYFPRVWLSSTSASTCQPVKFQYACLPTGSTSPECLDDDGAKNNEECWEDQGQNRHHLSPCRKKNEVKNWVWIETYRKKIQCTAQSFLSNNFVSTCLYTLEQQHYSCN